jgi:hypothetical protein
MIRVSRSKSQVDIKEPNLRLRANNLYVPNHEDSKESESYKASVRSICFDPAYRVKWSEITSKCVPFLMLKLNILLVKIPDSDFKIFNFFYPSQKPME